MASGGALARPAAARRANRPEKRGQEQAKSGPRAPRSDFRRFSSFTRDQVGPEPDPNRAGLAECARPVKAYPGGFRPGQGSTISNTLVTASGGRRNAPQAHTIDPLL